METLDKLNELFYDIPYDEVRKRFEGQFTEPSSPDPTIPEEELHTGKEEVEVVRVIDGDTLIVKRAGSEEEIRVRLLSIDSPELSEEYGTQPYATEAKTYLENILEGDVAYLEFEGSETEDSYGRLLAHVYNQEGQNVQEGLLKNGLAMLRYENPDSVNYASYLAAEEEAKANKASVWSTQGYATTDGFDQESYGDGGITRERYTRSTLSDDEKAFHSEAKKLGAKVKFKPSLFKNSTYTSFAGTDIRIAVSFKGGEPVVVGEAQTLSYSLFRPMEPVYALGSAKPRGFVRGPRTIAGSIIFTVFDRNVLLDKFYNAYEKVKAECTDRAYQTDELPPFDIHAVFMNEYGMSAHLVIHGVYISSEGQVMSIEDMITENTMQYVATDITLMQPGVE